MNYRELINGLHDNTIIVLVNGHNSNPLLERIEDHFGHIEKMIAEHTANLGKPYKDCKLTHEQMLDF